MLQPAVQHAFYKSIMLWQIDQMTIAVVDKPVSPRQMNQHLGLVKGLEHILILLKNIYGQPESPGVNRFQMPADCCHLTAVVQKRFYDIPADIAAGAGNRNTLSRML